MPPPLAAVDHVPAEQTALAVEGRPAACGGVGVDLTAAPLGEGVSHLLVAAQNQPKLPFPVAEALQGGDDQNRHRNAALAVVHAGTVNVVPVPEKDVVSKPAHRMHRVHMGHQRHSGERSPLRLGHQGRARLLKGHLFPPQAHGIQIGVQVRRQAVDLCSVGRRALDAHHLLPQLGHGRLSGVDIVTDRLNVILLLLHEKSPSLPLTAARSPGPPSGRTGWSPP